jgi:hypothetical protein
MRATIILIPVLIGCAALGAFGQTRDFAPMALNSYSIVPARFAFTKVCRQDGVLLGNIQRVDRGPDGLPGRVLIGISGPRVISLSARDVSYDEPDNVVVADMSALRAAVHQK